MSEKLSDEELQRIIKQHGSRTVGEIIRKVDVVGLMALELQSRRASDAGREWISVSEKYPDRYINVLCCLKSKSGFIAPMVGKLRNNGRFSCEIYENELPIVVVTHWQEIKLPQPPKE